MRSVSKSKKILFVILQILLFGLLIFLDQITKYAIRSSFDLNGGIPLIKGVLEFKYIENTGMAFSMMEGMTWFFYIVTPVIVMGCVYLYVKVPFESRHFPLKFCLVVLVAGAIGNYIDRIYKKSVTDFIYFSLIHFPVFNVADIYVVCSVIAIVLLMMFYYKEDELQGIM